MTKLQKRTTIALSIWLASILTGGIAVGIAHLTLYVQKAYFAFAHINPYWTLFASPLLFVLATFIIKKFAPEATGSGIPQVLAVLENSKNSNQSEGVWLSPLISIQASFHPRRYAGRGLGGSRGAYGSDCSFDICLCRAPHA